MPFFSRAGRAAALALLVVAPSSAIARDVRLGDLVIQHAWTRATPGGAKVAGGYVTVVNHGTTPDRLTGGSFEAASTFEMHDMAEQNGVMTMRPTGPIEIPPGGSLVFSPQGRHIMFTGLKHGLKKGQEVAGTLSFEHAGTTSVLFEVEAIGARAPSEAAPGRHPMPGMNMD